MNWILIVVHVGLYITVIITGLALCVLYVRTDKLERLVSSGAGTRNLIGFEVPPFEAIDVRTGQIVTVESRGSTWRCLLFVSSSCLRCQQLLHALQNTRFELDGGVVCDIRLTIYCQGSSRGSRRLLDGLDPRFETLVAHEVDVTNFLPIGSVPALLEIDSNSNVYRHTYPFSVHDLLSSIRDIGDRLSSHLG